MAEVKIPYRNKRGTLAEWQGENPVLTLGELGWVTDQAYMVIGDGSSDFATLSINGSQKIYFATLVESIFSTLSGLITAEANNRIFTDNIHTGILDQINVNLSAEIADRIAADVVLSNAIAAIVIPGIIDDLVTNDSTKTLSAAQGVVLKALIDAEAATRATADTSEASARAAGDATNATAITSEATTRAAADSSEASTRTAADTALQTSLDTLLNMSVNEQTGDYTLALSDKNKTVSINNSTNHTVTVPTNASVAFPVGSRVEIFRRGTGTVTIAAAGGVTILNEFPYLGIRNRYGRVFLHQIAADIWAIRGDSFIIDTEARAFIDACLFLLPVEERAVNQLVLDLKAYSIWTKMIAIYPLVGGLSYTHKFNLKNPVNSDGAYRLLFTGSPVHAKTGMKCGTSIYADTRILPSAVLTQNDSHMSFYSRDSGNGSSNVDMGCATTPGTNQLIINCREGGSAISDHYNWNTNRASNANADGSGFYLGSRTSSTVHKLFKNGTQIGSTNTSAASTVSSLNNSNIYLCGFSLNGSASAYTTKECAFASVGTGLNDTEAANLYTAVQAFQTALGRNV